ncbi:MAG: hypothetical protein Q4C06_08745 [Bacillota bacterium]|nr:hypothetical protein [Bacillota bacterium]
MKTFATGLLIGGAMTAAGVGYLMMDRKTCHKMARKGKRMVGKAEHAMDNLMDQMVP